LGVRGGSFATAARVGNDRLPMMRKTIEKVSSRAAVARIDAEAAVPRAQVFTQELARLGIEDPHAAVVPADVHVATGAPWRHCVVRLRDLEEAVEVYDTHGMSVVAEGLNRQRQQRRALFGNAEGDAVLDLRCDLPRRQGARAAGVGQALQHHPRRSGQSALAARATGVDQLADVQLPDRVLDEPREVALLALACRSSAKPLLRIGVAERSLSLRILRGIKGIPCPGLLVCRIAMTPAEPQRPAPLPPALSPLARLARSEAFPGVLVVSCALLAILIANSPWSEAWNHVWHTELALRVGDVTIAKSVAHWINDGLMVLFFYFVGLEIKHEVLDGQLRTFREAVLPVAAAAGGMFLPAAVFAIVVAAHGDVASARGWGIPMATDIAFALGVLALLGRRVPPSLKVFLATLAIVDDLGAVLVIAVFYTAEISWAHLGVGVLVLLVSYACNRVGVRRTWPYVVLGLALWILFLGSGVHATIAGVALALTVPARRALDEREFTRRGRLLLDEFDRVGEPDPLTNAQQLEVVQELQRHASDVQAPLQRMKHALHPLIAHLIVPLFALANAGVDLRGDLGETLVHPAAHGVFLGLVLGKPAGVLLATWAARRAFGSPLPDRTTWRHVHGVAWLAGIGFTMSLFIDSLAFASAPSAFAASKIAILAASLLAGVIGYFVLRGAREVAPRQTVGDDDGVAVRA
jgi:Na+:H+ antiporter, NhaA family